MFRRAKNFLADVLQQADMILLALCCAATLFGITMVYSATRYMQTNRLVIIQGCALVLGVVLYLLVSMVDLSEVVKKWKWLTMFNFGFILLLLTPFGRSDGTGNRAWLKFPGFPVSIQPAELVKLTFILVLAYQLVWLKEHRDLKSVPSVAMLGVHLLALVGIYYKVSADMGSALVYIFIFACVAFAAGVAIRWFVMGLLGGGIAFFLLWEYDKVSSYMKERFYVVFHHDYDPQGVGWQQTRGLMALGGGKLTGEGYLHGTQTQSSNAWSLPARHTDFIFCTIGEELGMIGCLLALALLTAIIVRCVLVARRAKSPLESYICVGIAAMLIFQTVINVGMCLFLVPVIGLTLPFFSYGGSSIVTLFLAMGMVSGIHKRTSPEWLR